MTCNDSIFIYIQEMCTFQTLVYLSRAQVLSVSPDFLSTLAEC